MIDGILKHDNSFSAILIKEALPDWEKYLSHPFLLALADGSLDSQKYRYYMIQDYLYLGEYGKCFSLGIECGTDDEFHAVCDHYLNRIRNFELDVHRGAFDSLGITQEDLKHSVPSLENLGYTSYMLKECYEGGQEEILTAILACALSYEYIAHSIVAKMPSALDHPLYGDWFEQYDSENYAEENVVLCNLLDRLTKSCSEEKKEHLKEIFHTCSRFEQGFWNGAWSMTDEWGSTDQKDC